MLSALTAWEDGGSAVLQAETAHRGLAACGGWRSHANDRTTTCYSPPTPSPPPRRRCSCLVQRFARERGDELGVRPGLAACRGWRSHASDRTTTCYSPTPSPPPRRRCSCLAQRFARERGDGSPRRCRTRSNHARRPERDRLSLERACRARSVSPGRRAGLRPPM